MTPLRIETSDGPFAVRKPEWYEKARTLRLQGYSFYEIGRVVGAKPHTVYHHIRDIKYERRRKPTQIPILSETERAYIACMVDTEGAIHLSTQKSHGKTHVEHWVTISNTNKELLEHGKYILGGEGWLRSEPRRNSRHRMRYELTVYKESSLVVLVQQILPFLIVKKKQATILLQYLESRLSKPYHTPYSESDYHYVEKLKL